MYNHVQQSELFDLIMSAYKKLKSAIYFDKTRTHLKQRIIEYETVESLKTNLIHFEDLLLGLERNPNCSDFSKVISSIKPIILPKEVAERDSSKQLISNMHLEKPRITKAQCFIDMDIEGYLLGVLWTMLIGSKIDDKFGNYIYGNRIQKQFKKNRKDFLSPYLFTPYFSNYEKWRDKALDIAERTLDEDKNDVVIVTSDLKSFYYSVDLNNTFWSSIDKKIETIESNSNYRKTISLKTLNNAVKAIITKYSEYFVGQNNILPIGFEPSMVLANLYLYKFDQAVINKISPLYYGRYVDDIIVVLKIEKDSTLDQYLQNETTNTKIIQYIFNEIIRDNNISEKASLAINNCNRSASPASSATFEINDQYLPSKETKIFLEEDKTKLFYLSHEAPRSFLKNFRKQIIFNASQFDLIPSIDDDIFENDFSFLFKFDTLGSPNRIRDISSYSISPYELSKFLGQAQKLLPLIDDNERTHITKKLANLLDSSSLIRFYTSWEKILKIVAFCNEPKLFVLVIKKIVNAIAAIEINLVESNWELLNFNQECLISSLKSTLLANISFALSLCSKSYVKKVENTLKNQFEDNKDFSELPEDFFEKNQIRIIKTYMVDRYSMPIPPVFFDSDFATKQKELPDLNLTDIGSIIDLTKNLNTTFDSNNPQTGLPYAVNIPYIIKKQDIQFALYIDKIIQGDSLLNPDEVQMQTKSIYTHVNFGNNRLNINHSSQNIDAFEIKASFDKTIKNYCIAIGNSRSAKQHIRVAIANMSIPFNYPTNYLNGDTGLTLDRYKKLFSVLKQTKNEKCDILILPELIIPIEWLPLLVQFSSKNNIAIIAGIGYIKSHNKANKKVLYNLTATLLPYEQDDFKFSYLYLHQKVYLPPKEASLYNDYDYEIPKGESFELFSWNNFWFSTYCCFELASPNARILYQSIADAIFAVEWNQDIDFYNYLGNVVARDLSCYFIQANNSSYGDSRIIAPANHFKKDIVRVTGGSNTTILVGMLNIDSIREGQRSNSGHNNIKPPAPDFNHNYALLKQTGKLIDYLKQQNKTK